MSFFLPSVTFKCTKNTDEEAILSLHGFQSFQGVVDCCWCRRAAQATTQNARGASEAARGRWMDDCVRGWMGGWRPWLCRMFFVGSAQYSTGGGGGGLSRCLMGELQGRVGFVSRRILCVKSVLSCRTFSRFCKVVVVFNFCLFCQVL